VQIGPFAPPGPPTANLSGSISAYVTVKEVPEPSTLALAGLCLALGGAGWWWKRTRAPLQPGPCC
jgi:LPXTG-motif cell wall-anchored protein